MELGFRAGARGVLAGLGRLARDGRLRGLAIAPLAIALLIHLGGVLLAALTADDLLSRLWAPPEGALRAVWIGAAFAIFAGLWALLALAFVPLAIAVAGPFHERIAGFILDEHGVEKRDVGFARGVAIDVGWAVAGFAPVAALAVLAWIPGIGLLFAGLSLVIASLASAVAAVGPALNATGRGFGARLRFLREHTSFAAGAAVVLGLSVVVPALGLLVIPAAVAGLTEALARAKLLDPTS